MGRGEQMTIIRNHRAKIPKQYAHVIKTSQLEDLMADIDIPVSLYYLGLWFDRYSIVDEIFYSRYVTQSHFCEYPHLQISAGYLPIERVSLDRKELHIVALPEFTIWIKKIMDLPRDSTYFNKTPILE